MSASIVTIRVLNDEMPASIVTIRVINDEMAASIVTIRVTGLTIVCRLTTITIKIDFIQMYCVIIFAADFLPVKRSNL